MAGIGIIGGIGQALAAGSGGYYQGKEDRRIIDLQNEQLQQQAEDRRRKMEREDFTFDRTKDMAESQDMQYENSLYDYLGDEIDPFKDVRSLYQKPVLPQKTQSDVDPAAISQGLVEAGNIPLKGRPLIDMGDGKVGSEYSIGIEEGGKEVLIPTIFGGARHSEAEAIQHYKETGEHLGKYDSIENANAAAQLIHSREDQALDDGSLGKLPGGSSVAAPRTGKTPALNKMTLGDFAGQGKAIEKKIAVAEQEYQRHRKAALEDVKKILKDTEGNPALRTRKLGAYYKTMEESPKFKTMQANYTNLLETVKQAKIAEVSLEILKALRSGDEETMRDLGLVNQDGSLMKVARDRTGNPIGLVGPFGVMGQATIAATAALEKGIGTFDGVQKAMLEDQKAETDRNRQASATERSSFSVHMPKPDSFIDRAREVTRLKAQLRKATDPETRQTLQDNIAALEQQIPDNTGKGEDRDQDYKLKVLNSYMKSYGFKKAQKPPTANEVIKAYETLKGSTDETTAEQFFSQVIGAWPKAGEDIMRSSTEYWKSKVRRLNPKQAAQNR